MKENGIDLEAYRHLDHKPFAELPAAFDRMMSVLVAGYVVELYPRMFASSFHYPHLIIASIILDSDKRLGWLDL